MYFYLKKSHLYGFKIVYQNDPFSFSQEVDNQT